MLQNTIYLRVWGGQRNRVVSKSLGRTNLHKIQFLYGSIYSKGGRYLGRITCESLNWGAWITSLNVAKWLRKLSFQKYIQEVRKEQVNWSPRKKIGLPGSMRISSVANGPYLSPGHRCMFSMSVSPETAPR